MVEAFMRIRRSDGDLGFGIGIWSMFKDVDGAGLVGSRVLQREVLDGRGWLAFSRFGRR
jgi:hypothetical protein